MSEKQKVILRVFFISLVPSILTILAKSNSILDNLQKNGFIKITPEELIIVKDYILIASIVFSTVFLSIRLAIIEIEKNTLIRHRECSIKYNKDNFLDVLLNKGLISHTDINIQLFVPEKGILLSGKK